MLKKMTGVFSSSYRNDTNYQTYLVNNLAEFRLNNKSESVDAMVERLRRENFESKYMFGNVIKSEYYQHETVEVEES